MFIAAFIFAFVAGYIACLWRYDPERLRAWWAAARAACERAAAAIRDWRERRKVR